MQRDASASADPEPDSGTPEQRLADFFARYPRRTPQDLLELARRKGIRPVAQFEELLGPGADDFDVDAFLTAHRGWKREGGPGFPWDEPDALK